MKAVRITEPGPPEVLRLVRVADPVPADGEVLIEVRAAGVNRADLLQRRGAYPAPPGVPADVPGLEYAGVVAEIGPGVEDWSVGDAVMGLLGGGAYAERVAVPAAQLLRIPDASSFVEAAGLPEVFTTAYDALHHRGRLAHGERVMIHAAGSGVGTAAIQVARLAGASRIFGTASAPKLARLEEVGLSPDVPIDYRSSSFREVVAAETDGEGVDVILDVVGAPYWEDNVACLATLGRMVLVGLLGGSEIRVELAALMRSRLTVVGTVLRARPAAEKARLAAEFARQLTPRFESGELRPVIDRVYPLAEAARAHAYVEADRSFGKVVLRVE